MRNYPKEWLNRVALYWLGGTIDAAIEAKRLSERQVERLCKKCSTMSPSWRKYTDGKTFCLECERKP